MALRFSSDKLNTDNPFIDLLLYTMKILVANSVIKDQYSADANETVDSLNSSSLYLACKDNNYNFHISLYTMESLTLIDLFYM